MKREATVGFSGIIHTRLSLGSVKCKNRVRGMMVERRSLPGLNKLKELENKVAFCRHPK